MPVEATDPAGVAYEAAEVAAVRYVEAEGAVPYDDGRVLGAVAYEDAGGTVSNEAYVSSEAVRKASLLPLLLEGGPELPLGVGVLSLSGGLAGPRDDVEDPLDEGDESGTEAGEEIVFDRTRWTCLRTPPLLDRPLPASDRFPFETELPRTCRERVEEPEEDILSRMTASAERNVLIESSLGAARLDSGRARVPCSDVRGGRRALDWTGEAIKSDEVWYDGGPVRGETRSTAGEEGTPVCGRWVVETGGRDRPVHESSGVSTG
jgi:hypothetical protein